MTYMDRIRAQYSSNRMQVLWLTRMTDEELSAFQFETGVDWLTRYTNDNRALLDSLLREPLIWKWWINNWNLRDDKTFLPALYNVALGFREARYRQMHQDIFIPQTPPYCLLEESYAIAINQFNDSL